MVADVPDKVLKCPACRRMDCEQWEGRGHCRGCDHWWVLPYTWDKWDWAVVGLVLALFAVLILITFIAIGGPQ